MDLPILAFVKVTILRRVCRVAVAEGELKRPAAAKGRCGILCSGSRYRSEQ